MIDILTYEVVTVACGGPGLKIPEGDGFYRFDNTNNRFTPCEAYQELLEGSDQDVLIYLHDDVTIHDTEWLGKILRLFAKDRCVAVGLGGATSLASRDLYRKRWDIRHMARGNYASNQTDAEVHGTRFEGERRVAVLDAFCMAVRRDFLINLGGWPVDRLSHHCLDLWLACVAARYDKEIWMTGASCTHHGGGTSTKPEYANAKWLQGGSIAEDHQAPHRWLAAEFRDILPIIV